MEKLLKFFETYKKYYKKGEQYTNGHLKFKDTITKEQREKLFENMKQFANLITKTHESLILTLIDINKYIF